jgi:serine/threonine protein kinase
MGELYRALDRLRVEAGEDDATVAIKILKPGLRKSAEALNRFRKEALNAQRLAHPNIVRVFDLDQSNGQFFITMEWLRGESLAARLDDIGPRPMVLSQAKRILEGLGAALEYTHREGLVHGDIKPGNVYLTSDHGVKLLDFGLAIAAASGPDSIDAVKRPFAITREYASREVLNGQRPTIQDDVFSLACLAYRLLAGYRPFKNGSRDATQLSRPKGLGPRQWGILRRGLASDRRDRPASVRELLDVLLAERWAPHRLISHRAAVAAVGMAVGAATLWVLLPQRPDPSAPLQPSDPPSSQIAPVVAPPTPVVEQPPAAGSKSDDPSSPGEPESPDMVADDPSPATQMADSTQTGEALVTQALPDLEAVSEPPPEASAGELSVAALEEPLQDASADELSAPLPEPDAPLAIEPGFAQGRYEVGESDTFVRLSVVAPRNLRGPVIWQIRTVDGAAIAGQDYIGNIADSITLKAGADSAEILIPIVSDALPEVIEDFIVVLDDPDDSAALSRSEAVVLIIDDDS